MAEQPPVLRMTGISKRFTAVRALSEVDFRLLPGEIHALLGENGAGKSTLIKVLTGVYERDAGTVELDGEPIEITSPHHAQQLGISTVYQEVNLCPNLTVAENIFLGRELTSAGPDDQLAQDPPDRAAAWSRGSAWTSTSACRCSRTRWPSSSWSRSSGRSGRPTRTRRC